MVVERGAVRRSKILSLLCAESMRWNMKLICEGTMLAIVPWAYLHCSFQNCIMPYSTMVVFHAVIPFLLSSDQLIL